VPLLPAERAQYSAIIDGILASGDLQTISAKQIRKGLEAKLDIDISDKKVCLPSLLTFPPQLHFLAQES
jgi:DEK C terminal domain